MAMPEQQIPPLLETNDVAWPILVCVLGNFRLLKAGRVVTVHRGSKVESLLGQLGIQYRHAIPRDTLLNLLWPNSKAILAIQSLHSLVHSLHALIGDAIDGAAPVLHEAGYYRLNTEVGAGVDVACFDALTAVGNRHIRAGDVPESVIAYGRAVDLYRGDLYEGTNVQAVIEREHYRARFMTLLGHLADYHFKQHDYAACMSHSWHLLAQDPCREDAHRMMMRCYVRQGERAEALRHYHLCENVLRTEFDAAPEPATMELFELIRLHPGNI